MLPDFWRARHTCGNASVRAPPERRRPACTVVVRAGRGRCRAAGRSAGGGLERVAEVTGLLGRHLDHQATTALERYAHHDAPTLLGHLQGTVTGPGLHRRHLPASFVVPAVAGAPGRAVTDLATTRPPRTLCGAAAPHQITGGILRPFSPMARTGGKPERSTLSPVRGDSPRATAVSRVGGGRTPARRDVVV